MDIKNSNHYTSTDGFYSIISNCSLRFTHSDFLNDPQDCKIFFEMLQNYLETIAENGILENKIKEIENKYNIENIEKIKELLGKFPVMGYLEYIHNKIDMYILSMTSSDDLLPMWNYYGGEGVQICFKMERLLKAIGQICCQENNQFLACSKVCYVTGLEEAEKLLWESFNNICVHSCKGKYQPNIKHYNNQNLKYFINSFVDSYIYNLHFLNADLNIEMKMENVYRKIFEFNRNGRYSFKFKKDIDLYMLLLGAFHKPKTYENEQEIRLVYVNYDIDHNDDVHYDVKKANFGSYIRPYVEFKIANNKEFGKTIDSVLLSPTVNNMPIDYSIYKHVIYEFMKRNLGCDIAVNKSEHKIRW